MKALSHARARARELRAHIGSHSENLLARLREFIETQHHIEIIAVPAAAIDEGRAEVSPFERALHYDERLDRFPADLLWVLAHEFGHLTLHKRLTDLSASADPLLGSYFLSEGAAALTRYSRKAREEAEANAFASEFISPTQTILDEWLHTSGATTASIAMRRRVPERIVRAQLAEALYELLLVPTEKTEAPKPRKSAGSDTSQLEAATFTDAPALVTAGPGTGKTATLIRRVEYLIAERGAKPEQFLILTFSNDATEELRQRIAARFDDGVAAAMEISTFHGFGLSFLHTYALELDPNAAILDDAAQEELLTALIGTLDCPHLINLRDPEESVKKIRKHIGFLKDRVFNDQPITPELFAQALSAWQPSEDESESHQKAHELLMAFRAYEAAKTQRPAIDFADLIALPVRVMQSHPQLVQKLRAKYRWVLVDEYQDVSRTVALLLKSLCSSDNPPWVVGDTRQAIYRFRGAAPENVWQFPHDFPDSRIFELKTNYRSCTEVVHTANQLASLMESESDKADVFNARWKAGTTLSGVGELVVQIARASSDAVEQEGIAAQVRAWLDDGVPPHEIAVLARRNLDVRDIVVALGKLGIKATTSGLITPEGAAGDLAAVVTLPDKPAASIARIVFALGRNRFSGVTLNDVTSYLLQSIESLEPHEYPHNDPGDEEAHALLSEIRQLCECINEEMHSGDAFALMCSFLFNGSDYLRRILKNTDNASRTLTLSEIVTSLTRAAAYRYSHPDFSPTNSRIAFGQHFRNTLSSGGASVKAPANEADAVRVMTCHASKGLEFPCVIVSGQTISRVREDWWLPPALIPSREEELEQADALLFVGATRAKRALLITCAESRTGGERGLQRELTPLLSRWQKAFSIPVIRWSGEVTEKDLLTVESIWQQRHHDTRLSPGALEESNCGLRTYLEDFVGLRFPQSLRALYPLFYSSLRLTMDRIFKGAEVDLRFLSPDEAAKLFVELFAQHDQQQHPHYELYLRTGQEYTRRFARALYPLPLPVRAIEPASALQGSDLHLLPLRSDLVTMYADHQGITHAITFRPESLAKNVAKGRDGELLWSGLKSSQRLSFLMLRHQFSHLQPWVFSAADGVLYKFLWSRRAEGMTDELQRARNKWQSLTRGRFEVKLNERACDKCPVRIVCPHWLEAI
jgi:superfamily I DNA/RNA helicase